MSRDTAAGRLTVAGRAPALATVFSKTLRDQRRALLWWAIGLVGMVGMYAAFYPSIKANADTLNKYIQSMPEAFRNAFMGASGDFASPAGYLSTETFNVMLPLLLLVFAIGAGARAIAGEEERQTLDILLSTPVPRRRVILDKFAAMVAATFGLAVVAWASTAVLGPPFGLDVELVNLAAAVASCFLLAVSMGGVAFAVGATTGKRGLAVGATSGLAVAMYLLDVFGPSVGWLEPFQKLSPFYYYWEAEPLLHGLNAFHAAVLAGIAVLALVVALAGFERRDLAA